GVANQTTMLKSETEEIGRLFERTMLEKYGPQVLNDHFLSFNTICDATEERQSAMFSLVDEPLDLLVVIGGFNSSNTTHLQEIAMSRGIRSFHIDTPERIGEDNTINHKPLDKDLIIEKDFLPAGKVNVGITSGASTPDRAVEHVIQKLIELSSR
ncbi:MAG: 4-hydroxy-3-methylbut-2-enyl diphosphate reductase, partial [Prochlorococcus sp.]